MKTSVFGCIVALAISFSASAQWQLSPQQSALHFVSTKNENITEVHRFSELEGHVSDTGEVVINIDLSSVDTNIEIRDERMRTMLFDTSSFTTATFVAALPDAISNMPLGTELVQLQGQLALHGATASVPVNIAVTKTDNNIVTASTVSPIILQASEFGLVKGIAALQKIAGLNSIGQAIPVTFSVTFTASNENAQ